ncbi:MAG TPA: acyltransferase [Isosphaeraceae bacterium]
MSPTTTTAPPDREVGAPPAPGRRYESLDSLRGVAAVCVVIAHLFGPILLSDRLPAPATIRFLRLTPMRIFWDGGSAVWLFFVLSGFVLALPYYSGRALRYGPYLVRRGCRIYPPYIVAVAAAALLKTLLYRGPSPTMTATLNEWWGLPTTPRALLDHLALISSVDERFDPVTWSLTQEMRVSILFPLIMAVLLRIPDAASLVLALAMVPLALRADGLVRNHLHWDLDLCQTWIYVPMFVIGALLAKHREALADRVASWPRLARDGLAVLAVSAIAYAPLLPFYVMKLPVRIYAGTFGTALLIVAALGLSRFSSLLHAPAAIFLGRVSYSIYLWHLIVYLGLSFSLREALPIPWVQLVSFALVLPVAALAYRAIEAPSIALGRGLSRRLGRDRGAADRGE